MPIEDKLAELFTLDDVSEVFIKAGEPLRVVRAGVLSLVKSESWTEASIEQFLKSKVSESFYQELEHNLFCRRTLLLGKKQKCVVCTASRLGGGTEVVLSRVATSLNSETDSQLLQIFSRFSQLEQGNIVLVGSSSAVTVSELLHQMVTYFNENTSSRLLLLERQMKVLHQSERSFVSQREFFNSPLLENAFLGVEGFSHIFVDLTWSPSLLASVVDLARTGKTIFLFTEAENTQALLRQSMASPVSIADFLAAALIEEKIVTEEGAFITALEYVESDVEWLSFYRDKDFEGYQNFLNASRESECFSIDWSLAQLVRNGSIERRVGFKNTRYPELLKVLIDATESHTWNVMELLYIAKEGGASDLHLTVGKPPVARVNGELQHFHLPVLQPLDIRHMLYSILTHEQIEELEENLELDLALELDPMTRFRVNAYFQQGSLAASFRTIANVVPEPQELGLPAGFLELANLPYGLIMVTGATGSGKSTSVACMVNYINQTRACRIITVEDPVEYVYGKGLSTIDQREVGRDTKTFSSALKYVLRQDPDVIVIGELRDLETISAALTAAETGHLVIATLHTNDACQTVDRIIDMYPGASQDQVRAQLATSLAGVLSQRLLPTVDREGRVAIYELLKANSACRTLIRENKTHQIAHVIETGLNQGMVNFDRSILNLLEKRKIKIDDAKRFVSNPKILEEASS